MQSVQMFLNDEEKDILEGKQGATLQKVMHSVVLYGEAFNAGRLMQVEGAPHFVTSFGASMIKPYFAMMDELIAAGLKSQRPFTVDPRPVDFDSIDPGLLPGLVSRLIYGKQAFYEDQLRKVGLKNNNAFSCACYLPEVGNVPAFGATLAWSESSAVVYANSVLGARTNRNSAGIDLMCNILGKAPLFSLLTDEGRRATWLVEVKTSRKPNPQLLGSAIGIKVVEDVPMIVGLDNYLGITLDEIACAYLKDMAVGLYHVENLTPEVKQAGRGTMVAEGYKSYLVDDAELERVRLAYPVLWKNINAHPRLAFIGCPHLSRGQVVEWATRFEDALVRKGKERLKLPVYMCSAPDVIDAVKKDPALSDRLRKLGARLTPICPLMYMNNPLCARQPIVTNSNKLRTYSTARFFLDDDLLEIAVNGFVSKGASHG
ncbi:MAG: aconitase X [Anaerolineaceae bacterium]